MKTLNGRIDFLMLISVDGANPNGDPLCSGRPRIDTDGHGIISDVCIKRKLRNRLSQTGEEIFITPSSLGGDTLSARADQLEYIDSRQFISGACRKWYDVRTFGQVFAFNIRTAEHRSLGIRGPVTIQRARSVHPVEIAESALTRCINAVSAGRRNADTFGFKSYVRYGLYVMKGSVCPFRAAETGFDRRDADKLKDALYSIFTNDASAARPEGSMQMKRLYWWQHDAVSGRYPAYRVFETVTPRLREHCTQPCCFDDYIIEESFPDKLVPEIYFT
ncbi:MAG: type I-C CRISPR-associated protein Cas7/Csd2 [Oscillospiraceae bacterium]|nr:type I-C CRISPR-associated protein Cas7/Csd2 [Oscillospiraceae bacterium]